MRLVRRSTPTWASARLPLVSLIDVVFLLLVFFMVTATLAPVESQLTSALHTERRQGGASADLQPQIIHVVMLDGAPAFQLGQRLVRSRDELTALLRALPREQGVFVRVAPDAPVAAAAAALQACADARLDRISYVAGG